MIAAGRPPSLSPAAVSRVVCKYFNFKNVLMDSVKALPSYEDRNYYFRGEALSGDHSEFTLKLSNPNYTTLPLVKEVNRAMLHIKSCGFPYSPPCPLSSRHGDHAIQLSARELEAGDSSLKDDAIRSATDEEIKYFVRILEFLPGQELDKIEKKYLTVALLHEVGAMIGNLDKALEVRYLY